MQTPAELRQSVTPMKAGSDGAIKRLTVTGQLVYQNSSKTPVSEQIAWDVPGDIGEQPYTRELDLGADNPPSVGLSFDWLQGKCGTIHIRNMFGVGRPDHRASAQLRAQREQHVLRVVIGGAAFMLRPGASFVFELFEPVAISVVSVNPLAPTPVRYTGFPK